MQNYDVQYFINKFKMIPYEKWGIGHLHAGGQSCALGHCGAVQSNTGYQLTDEGEAFRAIVKRYNPDIYITDVNDGVNDGSESSVYTQGNPKDRILALLYDVRDKQLEEANLKAALELVNEANCEVL